MQRFIIIVKHRTLPITTIAFSNRPPKQPKPFAHRLFNTTPFPYTKNQNIASVQVTSTKTTTTPFNNQNIDIAAKACNIPIQHQDEEEQYEEMFVEPDPYLGITDMEWGGPRRGGKFPEPTRFGDWERKGRCTDF